jgi:hypothetical protein
VASVQARAAGGSSREEGRLPATARSLGGRSLAEFGAERGFRLSAIVQTAAQHPEPQPQLQQVPWQDEGTLAVITGVAAEGFIEAKAFSSLAVRDSASGAGLPATEGLVLAAATRTVS